jgi:hypothetical protein
MEKPLEWRRRFLHIVDRIDDEEYDTTADLVGDLHELASEIRSSERARHTRLNRVGG